MNELNELLVELPLKTLLKLNHVNKPSKYFQKIIELLIGFYRVGDRGVGLESFSFTI